MKNFFQKFIALILILAMIFSLGLSIFLYKPKPAKAADLGGSWATFAQTLLKVVKDLGLDAVARGVASTMMDKIRGDLIRWAQGGFSDENKPFAMTSWKQEMFEVLNIASARFLTEMKATNLCYPITVALKIPGLTTPYAYVPTYSEYAACTIGDVVGNVKQFWENPSINTYGWDAWTAMAQPQNNIFSSLLMAAERKAEIEAEQTQEKEKEIETGKGYKSEKGCITWATETVPDEQAEGLCENNLDSCTTSCEQTYADNPLGLTTCHQYCGDTYYTCLQGATKQEPTGICLEDVTKKLGSTIQSTIEKTVGSDIDWLISTDEITELINVFFSAILNKAMHGISGLVTKPSYGVADYRQKYSYYQASRRTMTAVSRKELRNSVLSSIFDNLGQMNRRTLQCSGKPKEQQMRIEQMVETLPEILEGEVQHLYTGLEMVNLKSDYKVLDPPGAAFKVYGSTWDEIPFEHYPSSCAELTKEFGNNMRCKHIITNLPYELNVNTISPVCPECLARINTYLEQCSKDLESCLTRCQRASEQGEECETTCHSEYETCKNNAIVSAAADGKCSPPPAPGPPGPERPERPPFMYTLIQPMESFEDIFAQVPPERDEREEPERPERPEEPEEPEEPEDSEEPEEPEPSEASPEDINLARACFEGAKLIQTTKNRCNDCLEAAEQQCASETNENLKNLCINEACNNFEGIEAENIPAITYGLDFHHRCSIAEKKQACYVCLKEYFIPAKYCHQVLDYMARAFIKYPAVVYIEDYQNSWVTTMLNITSWLSPIGWISRLLGLLHDVKPGNWWVGWYDADSGCENNEDAPEDEISVSLICRAFTSFKYEGRNICKAWCVASDEERNDAADFEPSDTDCGGRKIGKAMPPKSIIAAGVFKARTKCCAALAADASTYRSCAFGEPLDLEASVEPFDWPSAPAEPIPIPPPIPPTTPVTPITPPITPPPIVPPPVLPPPPIVYPPTPPPAASPSFGPPPVTSPSFGPPPAPIPPSPPPLPLGD